MHKILELCNMYRYIHWQIKSEYGAIEVEFNGLCGHFLINLLKCIVLIYNFNIVCKLNISQAPTIINTVH